MREINPKHISALIEMINRGPYFELLSMKIAALDIGYSKVEINLERKHLNPFGGVHGGVYASLIDTTTYLAVYCELDEGTGLTTLDIKVDNAAMIKDGKIIAEGRSLKVGRSICLSEATARDEGGRLLAHGTSKLMVVQGRQSVSYALDAMGVDALPPKFL